MHEKKLRPYFLRDFFARFRNRPDSEHIQAFLGIIVSNIVVVFSLYLYFTNNPSAMPLYQIMYFAVVMNALMWGNLFWILYDPGVNHTRRIISMIFYLGFLCLGLAVASDTVALFYPILLWIIFGYGFRFGRFYLLVAAVIAVIGFSVVMYYNPYWHQQVKLSAGLLLALIVLPAYTYFLLKRLEQAQEKAVKANLSKTRFLAAMSHELRTPLNAIIGNSDILRTTKLDEEQRDMSLTVKTSASALLSIINDILDFSKIEANQMESEVLDFDLYKLLHDTRNMLAVQAIGKGIGMNLCVSSRVPRLIKGDQQHLRQVLINLMANALKFTDTGYVTVNVSNLSEMPGNHSLLFEVIDSGIGIPEGKLDKIFDSFSQADEGVSRKYGGTGLGLSISKQLVSLMGGDLTVDSIVGQGSRFWFVLDVPEGEAIRAEEEAPLQKVSVNYPILVATESAAQGTALLQDLQPMTENVYLATTPEQLEGQFTKLDKEYHHKVIVMFDGREMKDALPFGESVYWPKLQKSGCIFASVTSDYDVQNISSFIKKECLSILPLPLRQVDVDNLQLNASYKFNPAEEEKRNVMKLQERFMANGRSLRVLVAEDNNINRKVTGKILKRAGHKVYLAENGEEALDMLEGNSLDVVLLDMNMPIMSGLEVLQMFRYGNTDRANLPFIAFTADATLETKRTCEEAGFDGFISKPVEPEKLLETIEDIAGEILASTTDGFPDDADDTEEGRAENRQASNANSLPDSEQPTPLPALVPDSTASLEEDLSEEGEEDAFGLFASMAHTEPHALEGISIIDLEEIEKLKSIGDGDFFVEIASDFLKDGDELLQNMEKTLIDKDIVGFDDVAHALKSSTANIGAKRFYQYLVQYRTLERKDFELQAAEYYKIFRHEFDAARDELQKILDSEKAAG